MEMNLLIKRMAIGVAVLLFFLATAAYVTNRNKGREASLLEKLESIDDRTSQ